MEDTMSLGSKELLTAGVDMTAVLWKALRWMLLWWMLLWWWLRRVAIAGKVVLEREVKGRGVGRARDIRVVFAIMMISPLMPKNTFRL